MKFSAVVHIKNFVTAMLLHVIRAAAMCGALAACSSTPQDGAAAETATPAAQTRSIQPLHGVTLPNAAATLSPRSTASPATPGVPIAASALPDFPWPPPAPSEQLLLPETIFQRPGGAAPSLATVGDRIIRALRAANYLEYSFYRAPGGFALVARLERMSPDGTPLPAEFRYIPPDAREPFSLTGYIRSLFFAPEGFYRLIVFVVTDQSFVTSQTPVDAAGANRLLRNGANRLPEQLRSEAFTPAHGMTVLIYEYRKGHADNDVAAIVPGRLAAETHLQRTQIERSLQQEP